MSAGLARGNKERTKTVVRSALSAAGVAEPRPALEAGRRKRGATLSAIANQQFLPNAHFEAALAFANGMGAVGINVAYSGTVIGVLFTGSRRQEQKAADVAERQFGDLGSVRCVRLVGGGVRAR